MRLPVALAGSLASAIAPLLFGRAPTMVTGVPDVGKREAGCRAAELIMRKQPDDWALPMDLASLVPWVNTVLRVAEI
jgi:hypothetical protein